MSQNKILAEGEYLWTRSFSPVWLPLIESMCNIQGTFTDSSTFSSETILVNKKKTIKFARLDWLKERHTPLNAATSPGWHMTSKLQWRLEKERQENSRINILKTITLNEIRMYITGFLLVIDWNKNVILLKYIHFSCPFPNTAKTSLAVKNTRRVFAWFS